MDDAFEVLEKRIRKAVELIRRLQGENAELTKQLGRAQAGLQQAEKALHALERQKAAAADGDRVETLGRELSSIRKEREELKSRIAKLVDALEGLD